MLKQIDLFTDGSCLGNPGPGGYGAVMVYGKHRKEISAGFRLTTNNRMELMAAIMGLRTLNEPCQVRLTTDSQYVRQDHPMDHRLEEEGLDDRQPSAGQERRSLAGPDAEVARHQIEWLWVKGHSGHPENERCDELAREAASGKQLAEDSGYQP